MLLTLTQTGMNKEFGFMYCNMDDVNINYYNKLIKIYHPMKYLNIIFICNYLNVI